MKGIDQVLLKNSNFKSKTNNQLILSLDTEYKALLTEKSLNNLEQSLSLLLGQTTVKFDFEALKELTITQQNTLDTKNKKDKMIANFLADEALQDLEKVFNTKATISTIKEIGEENV